MRTVTLNDEHCRSCAGDEGQLASVVAFLDGLGRWVVPPGELSVALLDEAAHCELHLRFLADPTPTDVITFPGDPDDDLAGEIILNAELACREAASYGQTPGEELALYFVHGWLHLAGLDDHDELSRSVMRSAEAELLSALREAALMPNFESR